MIALSLETTAVSVDVRWIDLAAFIAMGALWLLVALMLYGVWRILRSKARGDAGWGDSPGM